MAVADDIEDIEERLMAAIADAMPMRTRKRVQIDRDTRLHADLGLDSLGLLALLFRMQEAFSVEIDGDADVDIGSLRTVGELIQVLRTLLAPALGDAVEIKR
jgi:acyl carrier protein